MRALTLALAAAAVLALPAPAPGASAGMTEVVVTLDAPSLAAAVSTSKALEPSARTKRLDLTSPSSRGYLEELHRLQDTVLDRLHARIPTARVRWRYAVVLNGFGVSLPTKELPALARVPGVRRVFPAGGFRATLDRGPELIGADELWNDPVLPALGDGIKVGVIDDGVDPDHPFFDPTGYAYPAGFPKGNTQFTTPKIIVARAFAPRTTTWKYARLPFDPVQSEHGTHVAGIAAGNAVTVPIQGRASISGVAPRAYIGNYKALSTPSPFGLIDNAPEVVAAIEAAVRDGMDVINMSFGEFETDPSRNPVDAAVDGAAAAGVIPVAAAGNSYDEFGRGSVGSPATARRAIAVGAVTKARTLAEFSSSGPTALALRMKPEISAPGVAILSSVPARLGSWSSFSGTSMAAPHVAGAVALLRQRHPEWTVDEITSALVLTGRPVADAVSGDGEAATTRQGGGLVNLPAADLPRVFARPYALSFGLVAPGATVVRAIDLRDAGGGGGTWAVSSRLQTGGRLVTLGTPESIAVPGRLEVSLVTRRVASAADVTGFVVLERGGVTRHIPVWFRVGGSRLGAPARSIARQGTYRGDTRTGRALVTNYRYPDAAEGAVGLRGPEQVFRIRVPRLVANVGVRTVTAKRGVRVTPRIVSAGDESRLAGVPALPLDVNPFRDTYGTARPVAAVIRPAPGTYDVVFDSAARASAGSFAFRVWFDDTAPPRVRLLTRTVAAGGRAVLAVADGGSGVDPQSVSATVDGRRAPAAVVAGRVRVSVPADLARGSHALVVSVADYQETKNSESVAGILRNTSVLRATVRVSR